MRRKRTIGPSSSLLRGRPRGTAGPEGRTPLGPSRATHHAGPNVGVARVRELSTSALFGRSAFHNSARDGRMTDGLVRVPAGHLAFDHALHDHVLLDAPAQLVGLRGVEVDVLV